MLGCFMDAILARMGVFVFDGVVLPLWLIAMWYMFSMSLPFAFGFLRTKFLLAAFMGAIGATTSYVGGSAFRADIQLMESLAMAAFAIALSWSVFLPYAYFQLMRMEEQ